MKIKNYIQYIKEISGTELVGHMGPNYPDQDTSPMDVKDDVIFCPIDSKIYTYDDYQSVYQDYLKSNGTPLFGFNEENLIKVISHLNN
jgi:hypothetical protein